MIDLCKGVGEGLANGPQTAIKPGPAKTDMGYAMVACHSCQTASHNTYSNQLQATTLRLILAFFFLQFALVLSMKVLMSYHCPFSASNWG